MAANIGFEPVTQLGCFFDGIGHGIKNDLFIDRFFLRDGLRNLDQLKLIGTYGHDRYSSGAAQLSGVLVVLSV